MYKGPITEDYRGFDIIGRMETMPQALAIVEATNKEKQLFHFQEITDDIGNGEKYIQQMIPAIKECIDGYFKYLEGVSFLKKI